MFHSVNKFRTPVTILLSLIAVSFMGYGFVSLQGISRDNYIVKVGDQIITRYALDQAVQNTEAAGEPASREAVFQTARHRGQRRANQTNRGGQPPVPRHQRQI